MPKTAFWFLLRIPANPQTRTPRRQAPSSNVLDRARSKCCVRGTVQRAAIIDGSRAPTLVGPLSWPNSALPDRCLHLCRSDSALCAYVISRMTPRSSSWMRPLVATISPLRRSNGPAVEAGDPPPASSHDQRAGRDVPRRSAPAPRNRPCVPPRRSRGRSPPSRAAAPRALRQKAAKSPTMSSSFCCTCMGIP